MSAFFFAVPGIYDLLDIHTPVTLRIPQTEVIGQLFLGNLSCNSVILHDEKCFALSPHELEMATNKGGICGNCMRNNTVKLAMQHRCAATC